MGWFFFVLDLVVSPDKANTYDIPNHVIVVAIEE